MKKIISNLSVMFALSVFILAGCGSGGSNTESAAGGTNTNTGVPSGQVKLTGIVQADPGDTTAINEQKNATVYVIGQQNNTVKTDDNGNYSITCNVQLSSLIASSPSFISSIKGIVHSLAPKQSASSQTYGLIVISDGNDHGRKTEVQATEGQDNAVSTIYINTVGSISGRAYLQNATNNDNTGIMVYIPGTSFSAMTAADGSFTISGVPSGTYDFLRAEKDGYRHSLLSNINVKSNASTTVADQLLFLSTGATGQIMIANGAVYSTSRTVKLNVASSSDAVLMMLSDNAFFSNSSWQTIQSTTTYTFTSDGEKTLWVKFADANGLESAAYSSSTIYVDSNPMVSLQAPAPSASIRETTPVFTWSPNLAVPGGSYHIQVSLSSGFTTSLVNEIVSSPTYTLPSSLQLSNNATVYCRIAIVDNGVDWNWAGPWSFTVDIGKVSLLLPVPYATTDTNPIFSWSDSVIPNAVYRIQIARNATFTDLFEDSAVTIPALSISSYTPANTLVNNKLYYWRVAVIDNNGVQGGWSPGQTFTVNLGSSTLYSPSGITNDSKQKLSWSDSPLPGATYRVQLTVSSDSTFVSPLVDAVVATSNYTPTNALGNGAYHWRVAVIDANGYTGNYSTPLSFSVDIGTVTLSSPAGAVPYSRPTFGWSTSALANAKYRIQIARDSGFTNLQEDSATTAPSGLTSPSYAPVNTLQNATAYYWRVQVIDANGTIGAWSAILSFSVDLGTVVLLTPADGSFIANTTSILDWSDSTIPGSKTYDVQLSTDATFSVKLVNQAGLASSQYTIGTNGEAALTNGQAFYWRTMVVDANGVAGQWATSGKPFTVNLGTVNIVGPSGAISDTKPTISWTASSLSGAKYWLQVSNDNSNWTSSLIVNTTLTSATSYALSTALANNATYYVRVAVVDANNVPGDWAGPQAFTVNIGTITLQSPADLAALTNTRPTLNWSASTLGPNAKYHVQVATDTGFTNIVEQSDTGVNTATYTLTAGLPNGQPYYWHVAVIDANNVIGAYCTFRNFSIDLGTVSLLTPGGSTNNTTPTLDWSDSALPGVSYRVQLSASSGFGSTLADATTAAGVSQYTVPLANKLNNGITYWWRVKVIDGNNVPGAWTSAQSFTVDLGTVSLTSPSNGATIGQTTPSFTWSVSVLPSVKYHIQVADNTSFSPLLAEATNISTATYTLLAANKLIDLTTYFWRVSVIDQNGVEGNFCSYASFNVNIGTVDLSSPLSPSSTNTRNPTFTWSANSNASTYTLILSTNSNLSGGTNYVTSVTNYSLPSFTLPATSSTVWYWAVTPVDVNGVLGTQSTTWNFTLDTNAPTGGIVINGGATKTSSETVSLTLSASDPGPGGTGVNQMWVSTNSSFSDGAWESFSTLKQFTFAAMATQNAGTMTAYVKYSDVVGNISGVYSASINLSRTLKSGTLISNETWTAGGSPYVIQGNVLVSTGVTLTINPGVIVKFNSGMGLNAYMGTLVAQGTYTNPITFTSNKYDPAPGDWAYIYFPASSTSATFDGSGNYASGSILEWCVVEYAGSVGYGAVRSDNSQPFVNNCDIRNNTASGIYAFYYHGDIKLTNNIIRKNNSTGNGGGIYAFSEISPSKVIISNSMVINNSANNGGGMYIARGGASVSNSIVSNNTAFIGGGVELSWITFGVVNMDKLTISGNRASSNGDSFYLDPTYSACSISNSTISDNTSNLANPNSIYYGGNQYDTGVIKFNYNNLFRNGTYEYFNNTVFNLDATNNFWGTSTRSVIQSRIYDGIVDPLKGIVSFDTATVQIVSVPSTTAPISPPSGLTITSGSAGTGNITVSWTANPESNVGGYRVYYGTSSGYPYSSSVDVGNAMSELISGPTGSVYYVTVTAYRTGYSAANDVATTLINDNQTNGIESWYAKEQQVTLP